MRSFRTTITVAAVYCCVLAGVDSATAQPERRGLIERALDEPTHITLEKITLGEAIPKLTEQTGVKIFMPPEVMRLAPYGAETVVQRIALENITLRQGLTELLGPLGMTFRVEEDHVSVHANEAIRCLGRAPTWTELDTLAELAALQPGSNEEHLAKLRGRVQFRMPVREGWNTLALALRDVGAGAGDQALAVACANLGWAWCLSDRQIVITSQADLIQQRLTHSVSLRMNYRPLINVLQELGRIAGVRIHAEPGALASLPLQVQQNFSLNVQNKPADEVLESIAAYTGLGYLIEPDGVLFFMVTDERHSQLGPRGESSSGTADGDPYVGKIIVPLEDGRSIEWLIRRSELPPDLRDRRAEDLRQAFESLRQPTLNGDSR